MTDRLGKILLGRYRLTAALGQGGMGAVWRARDEQLGRDVAVKELRLPDHLSGEERENWIARLDREARAAARLKDHGIVTVHDRFVDPDTGRPWIVMELVEGGSLADLLAGGGALPPAQVARIGMQVLSALCAAHEAGITHRDIKPANILLEGDRVVLTDFGIAAMDGDATLTASGMILGTPAFMAPEQVRGAAAGAASDLWSLGATLYTAVEGRPPFPDGGPGAVLVAVATEDPAPAVRAGLLAPALTGLLRKDPAERLTADRLRDLLAPVAADEPSAADEPPRPVPVVPSMPDHPPPAPPQPQAASRRRRMVLAAVVAALLVGGTVTGYRAYQDHQLYAPSHHVIDRLGTPEDYTRTTEDKLGGGKIRAHYTKAAGCESCLQNGDLDAVRTWLQKSPYVRSVGSELHDPHSSGCGTVQCPLDVTPRGEPGVQKVAFSGAGGTVGVDIVVG